MAFCKHRIMDNCRKYNRPCIFSDECFEPEEIKPKTSGVTVQEWISVKDRLPEQGERVLATDGGFVGELYVNSRCQWQRYNVNDHSLLMALDILWWMPLPEPPKENDCEKV